MNIRDHARYAFMVCNAAISIAGFVWFILGNINHKELWFTLSFIGGFIPTVALFFIIYGLVGLFAVYRNHEHALTAYGGITVVSLLLRVVNWILFKIHSIAVDNTKNGLFIAAEAVIISLVVVILRFK